MQPPGCRGESSKRWRGGERRFLVERVNGFEGSGLNATADMQAQHSLLGPALHPNAERPATARETKASQC